MRPRLSRALVVGWFLVVPMVTARLVAGSEDDHRPRLVFQAYLIRLYAAYMAWPGQGSPGFGWNSLGGGAEVGSVAVGCSFSPHWAVAVGTKSQDRFSGMFEEGGYSRWPVRFFLVNYHNPHPLSTRLAYLDVDWQPKWFDNDDYVAVSVGVAQTFYGVTPGAELQWRMPPFYPKYGRLALGLTLGLGGWLML